VRMLESESPQPRPKLTVGGPDPEIVLDISRLIARAHFSAPTGVDRVEMAYAAELFKLAPDRLGFAAAYPWGLQGRLATAGAIAFLKRTAQGWKGEASQSALIARSSDLLRLWPRLQRDPIGPRMRKRVYLQVSPNGLDRPETVRRILQRERARFVCLVHDLIPIEHPEYARPKGAQEHRQRIGTIAEFADGVITPSAATRDSLLEHLGCQGRFVRTRIAPLGADRVRGLDRSGPTASSAYFVMVGTIEPRKNHLLLLNLWRRFAETLGVAAPRLVLIGRRGWENENILDMLERCPGLKDLVEERGQVSDTDMCRLIQDARAVLMPSFAEGFCLPIIEALQLGVPVLCSDIPTHREVAAGFAEFIDPLDGPAWARAILDYAAADSRRRSEQVQRIASWRAPTWETHVKIALEFIDEISQ
jgi:glycosyltransferase involved in cell wall biosynthesis